jgi:hypothetical protein
VHLGVVVKIDRCKHSKRLIEIPKVSRLANVSRFVDKIKAVGAALTLGTDRLLARQQNDGKNQRCNATQHLFFLLFKQANQAERPKWSPKGKYSEPSPKASANAKAGGVYLEDPSSLFVPWTMASFFSAADIVFLVTVLSSHVSPRSSYQQLIFQTRFTANNWQSDFLCIAVIKRAWSREAASMNSPRL